MPVRNVTFHHANRKDTVNMGKYPFKDVEAPSPGSPLAKKRGCTCPIIDNNYGKGSRFVQRADCPIHGFDPAA